MTNYNEDIEHLRLLSIFHYVVAALAAFLSCFALLYLFVGLMMATGGLAAEDIPPVAAGMGWVIFAMATCGLLAGWGFAFCLVLAGRYLTQHENYTFCLVMAAINCTFMPFGTVLGVFTILVLMRNSVKDLFGKAPDGFPASEASSISVESSRES